MFSGFCLELTIIDSQQQVQPGKASYENWGKEWDSVPITYRWRCYCVNIRRNGEGEIHFVYLEHALDLNQTHL